MAKPFGKLNLSEEKVSQKINLDEAFGVDLSRNEALKQRIAQAMIDRIIERSESGKSIHNKPMRPKYSKEYKNSKEYELYGKTGKVNVKLKGDMLNDVDIISTRGNNIEFGLEGRQAVKGFAHQTGYDGHPSIPNGKYKREWFGVNKKELNDIKKEFKNELQQVKKGKEEIEERQEQEVEQERLDLATIRALAQGERQTTSALDALIGSLFGESEIQ